MVHLKIGGGGVERDRVCSDNKDEQPLPQNVSWTRQQCCPRLLETVADCHFSMVFGGGGACTAAKRTCWPALCAGQGELHCWTTVHVVPRHYIHYAGCISSVQVAQHLSLLRIVDVVHSAVRLLCLVHM
jgi:hypothetical protein